MLPLYYLLFGCVVSSGASSASTAYSPDVKACGDIVQEGNYTLVPAQKAYNCLISVPFDKSVATKFIRYYNDTLQFQSTLAYLKDPPSTYKQPPTDLMAGLAKIQKDIDDNNFWNEYDFEQALQHLIYSAHDSHLGLTAGILAAFTFTAPFQIASVSLDGIELPKIYSANDLYVNYTSADSLTWRPSAITAINDIDAVEYLSHFARMNSIGGLEAHADWNMLMQSPALDIQGHFEVFGGGATFYPGASVNFTFENNTRVEKEWYAIYSGPNIDDVGALESGDDFYNLFVLGRFPHPYNESASSDANDRDDVSTKTSMNNWENPAYPTNPDVVQQSLGTLGGGFITGYLLNDSSLAVLSIPSFAESDDSVDTFSATIAEFISRASKANLSKIIIDLQQNSGGDELLAIDAFKQFFPSIDPFGGSRMRLQPMADVLGNVFTQHWDAINSSADDYYHLVASEWVVTDRIDAATGENFASWAKFFETNSTFGSDKYSQIERYNLSSVAFDMEASGGIVVDTGNRSSLFAGEDIMILSDGLCSSSCAIFVEMMHREGGVRTVAVGGHPSYGPMQVPGQSRGASAYTNSRLDKDILNAKHISNISSNGLPDRKQPFFVTSASFNLRDQVRRENITIPLQFLYEPADCRIFFTPSTWYNYTDLWKHAAEAIWHNVGLCVKNSTGYDRSEPEQPAANTTDVKSTITSSSQKSNIPIYDDERILDGSYPLSKIQDMPCKTSSDCAAPGHYSCRKVRTCPFQTWELRCVAECNSSTRCSSGRNCRYIHHDSIGEIPGAITRRYQVGYCVPSRQDCDTDVDDFGDDPW